MPAWANKKNVLRWLLRWREVNLRTRGSKRATKNGDFSNVAAQGGSPQRIGAVGGNIGLVDGSVNWKPISQMKQYRGWSSQLENECWALW